MRKAHQNPQLSRRGSAPRPSWGPTFILWMVAAVVIAAYSSAYLGLRRARVFVHAQSWMDEGHVRHFQHDVYVSANGTFLLTRVLYYVFLPAVEVEALMWRIAVPRGRC